MLVSGLIKLGIRVADDSHLEESYSSGKTITSTEEKKSLNQSNQE